MEKINRHNYEAYFLDYAEGNLSHEDRNDLKCFLEVNPDLKAELEEDFGDFELFPTTATFVDKKDLKFDEGNLIINPAIVDDFMVAAVEGELCDQHLVTLQQYILKHGLEKEFKTYQASFLKPDPQITYSEKSELKKGGYIVRMNVVSRVASIAAVGLVLIGFAWNGYYQSYSPKMDNTDRNLVRYVRTIENRPSLNHTTIIENNENLAESNHEHLSVQNKEKFENKAEKKSFLDESVSYEIAESKDSIPAIDLSPLEKIENADPDFNLTLTPLDSLSEKPINDEAEFIALNRPLKIRKEEPYKLLTQAAGDVVNREVKFTRDKDIESDTYVAYSFSFGKFEFERKKSR
ncbi:hypothetical protein [Crocinitomix algicola]|uniref:hypothetical protein n=1 Tax=Crocinitomix algicola TaxID=1740263 RepID=UPI0008311799|nr:hypothetical protein [Crocinitomix algicola]